MHGAVLCDQFHPRKVHRGLTRRYRDRFSTRSILTTVAMMEHFLLEPRFREIDVNRTVIKVNMVNMMYENCCRRSSEVNSHEKLEV